MKCKAILILLGCSCFIGNAVAQEKEKNIAGLVSRDTLKVTMTQGTPSDSLDMSGMTFKTYKKKAHASYYSDKFNGRKTASGAKFHNAKYTAAHRKFPFGTKLRVTNEANGKSVIVEVNDRGPFSKVREIDLTKKAFMEITHHKGAGGLNVTIEEVISEENATTANP